MRGVGMIPIYSFEYVLQFRCDSAGFSSIAARIGIVGGCDRIGIISSYRMILAGLGMPELAELAIRASQFWILDRKSVV